MFPFDPLSNQEFTTKAINEIDIIPVNMNAPLTLSFYHLPHGVLIEREQLAFDMLDLVGNVGRNMGLLLRWSPLSIVRRLHSKIWLRFNYMKT